jgi:2'-5' RNA ligase
MMKRLFVGVRPSPEDLRDLVEFQHRLAKEASLSLVRWTREPQIHLTLNFLGDVADIPDLGAIDWPPAFVQPLDHVILFPEPLQTRVIGVGGPVSPPFADLVSRISKGTKCPLGTPYPHITLGRVRSPLRLDAAELPVPSEIRLNLTLVTLFQSHLGPEGSRYEMIGEFRLAKPREAW